jgi:hypothetical protein
MSSQIQQPPLTCPFEIEATAPVVDDTRGVVLADAIPPVP